MIQTVKAAVLILIALLCILFYPYLNHQNIEAFIKGNGTSAPLFFVAVCAARPLLFFLPSMGLTIVAGTLFGAAWGTVYVAVGGLLSTVVGYYSARWLGRDTVKRLLDKSRLLTELEKLSLEHGKKAVLYMRLFNLPWDLVSYWAGLSGVNFRDFYLASLIPLLPVSFLYTYFGSRIFTPFSAGFIVSLTAIFLMGAAPYIRRRWLMRSHGR